MSIREATEADIPELHRIRSSVHENTLRDYSVLTPALYRRHLLEVGRGWVFEQEGQMAGFAIANRDEASIWALFVEPSLEGRGIGRALHDHMVGWLRSEGLRFVALGTDPGTRAARFYESAGWVLQGLDSDGEAIYELTLDGSPAP